MIVSNCQHCDEQQLQTLSCVHYKILSVLKLDVYIRALLIRLHSCSEKNMHTLSVHLVFASATTPGLFLAQNTYKYLFKVQYPRYYNVNYGTCLYDIYKMKSAILYRVNFQRMW